jgi:16S rRNA (adenine1518-N6/adenine1519-N6)-dimethyltransferase
VKARKRFGQHFLLPAWADKVIGAIDPAPGDDFLEIGPGAGALTSRLARRVRRLTAIEIDRDLAADLRPQLPLNTEIVVADFLETDLGSYLARGPLRVAGNLPYNLSSPIIFKLLAAAQRLGAGPGTAGLIDATVMLQREVADRLVARVGTKDYGVLTIFTALEADVRRVLSLPPGAFRPAPKVHSAVVRLTFKASPLPPGAESIFDPMVRTIFMQRRKTLLNALRPYAESIGRDTKSALDLAGIDPVRRPETLTQQDLLRLVSALAPNA